MFENSVNFVYNRLLSAPKDSYSKPKQLLISFGCGYWAGIFTAIASHPGDTMVSYINKRQSNESALV